MLTTFHECHRRIRKIAVLMASIFLSFVAVNAQNISLDMKDVSIKTVLKEIQRTTDYKFVFNDSQVDVSRIISVKLSNLTIQKAMDEVLVKNGISYKIVEKQIILAPREFKNDTKDKAPQNLQVKGIVKDVTGQPIPGVFVFVKDNNLKTAFSDTEGRFFINAGNNDILCFSFLGMKSQEIHINGRTTINVLMEEDVVLLENVVVTGYQTIEKGRATGSFEMVSSNDLSKTIVSNNFVDKLEGIVPGLSINSDGEMLIRGQATIYAETKPLVVVDGFPMEYGTENINPNDIESISVLKDAASAAIWGVRAANGVVVITTKRGAKNQKTKVSYTGNVKLGSKFDLSSMGYLNSAQTVDFEREKFANYPTSISTISADQPYSYSEAAYIEYRYQNGQISENERESLFTKLGSYDNLDDISKNFYRNSLFQTHNIVVSGGTDNITNYLSINYENNLADLIGNERNRFGAQLNSTFDISKRVRLTTSFRANYSVENNYTGTPSQMLPYVKLLDENGNYVNEYNSVSQLMKDDLESKGYGDWSYNRLKDRSMTDNKTNSYNVSTSAQLDIDIVKGLKFTTSGVYIIDHSDQSVLHSKDSYYTRDLYNQFTGYNSGILTFYLPDGAIKDTYNSNSSSFTFRNVLNYNFEADRFSMSLMGGCEMFALRTRTQSDTYYGYDPQGMTYDTTMNMYDLVNVGVVGYSSLGISSVQRLTYAPKHTDVENRYFSSFFTGTFSYDKRYTLFGSVRYDKTNLYGRSAKYRDQPTWSVGGKWNISDEKFFKSETVNQLSFKASYGLSGNVDKSTSPYLIASNSRDIYLGLPVLIINNPANPELAWEKVYSFNAGLEIALFKNRLNLSVDYYSRNTKDALGNMVIDPTTGWTSALRNSASLTNKGVDWSISGSPVSGNNWNWISSLTFSYNYNEVTEVNAGEETLSMATSHNPLLGKPVDYVFAFKNDKLSNTGQLQIIDADGETHPVSDINTFTVEDLQFIGRLSPTYFGAWTNSVSFNGFQFDMLITYKFGNKMKIPSMVHTAFQTRPYKTVDERWRNPGDEETTWVPATDYMGLGTNYTNMIAHEKTIQNGSVVRLKSISLSYDFKRIIKSDAFSGLNLKLAVENCCFWAANSYGLDPDRMYYDSYQDSHYLGKQPTYYTLTLNLNF